MTLAEPQIRRWTREEYYRLAEKGWFAGQRVQLIHGEIIQMPALGHFHCKSVLKTEKTIESICGPRRHVRVQMPLDLPDGSQPEPDLAVVSGTLEDYNAHPTTALLVVEVSDTTLRLDRRKTSLYASAGIAEYWIVNLKKRELEVHREPIADSTAEFNSTYGQVMTLGENDTIAPLAHPESKIPVRDLLP